MRSPDGAISAWMGIAVDIEDQKQMELALRRSEREASETATLLTSIDQAAPIGLKLVDRDFRIVRINQMLVELHGLGEEEILGRTIAEVTPELWAGVETHYRRALNGETIRNVDITGRDVFDPHRMRYWLSNYFPVWVDGEIIGVGNVAFDITERKEEDEFRTVVMDNVAEGICAVDGDGLVTYVNPAACKMLGWTEEELLGTRMHERVHFQHADGTPHPAEECPMLQGLADGRTVQILDDAYTRQDGSILPVAYSSAPLRSGPTVHGVVVVFRDTTEEKKERDAAERELATLSWVGRIREAIDEDRLVLYAQPIVPLGGGAPSEELLLRMVGRDGEVILPGSFLPVAERFGLIAEIDRWVIARSVRRAAEGAQRVDVNLSAASMGASDLLPYIERQLREAGADPGLVVFEITETALMRDAAAGENLALWPGQPRLRDRSRRLRHGVRELHLSEAVAHHLSQDRPRLRARPRLQSFEPPRRPRHRQPGPGIRPADDR